MTTFSDGRQKTFAYVMYDGVSEQYQVVDPSGYPIVSGLAGSIADGDKGDIVVTGGLWGLDNNVVTLPKMAQITGPVVLGKLDVGTGNVVAVPVADLPTSDLTQSQLDDLGFDIATKQDIDFKLDALIGTGASPGLIENVNATTVALRPVGVAASTDIPSRANVDARFLRQVEVMPGAGEGVNGDAVVFLNKPNLGSIARKVGGAWAFQNKTYTWAGRPDPAVYPGEVITISDWGQEFFSDGVRWVPTSKHINIVLNGTAAPGTPLVGNGAAQTLASDSIPAGLVAPHCLLIFRAMMSYVGATATKTPRCRNVEAAENMFSIASSSISTLSQGLMGYLQVGAAVGAQVQIPNTANFTGLTNGSNTQINPTAINFANITSWTWDCTHTSPDTAQIVSRQIEIVFP